MLYYKKIELHKDKDWVVFIHGAGGSSAVWFKQIKYYRAHFNLLLIDLRGHGKSAHLGNEPREKNYSFQSISEEVFSTLDHAGVEKAHFLGVSLGTIIVRQMSEMQKERVSSMVLVGAVTYLNFKSRFWVTLGRVFKNVLPFMWLYRLFAFVIMPSKTHKESRNVFITEAQKLCQREFLRWFKLTGQLSTLLEKLNKNPSVIPTLYVMGEQDYLMLEPIKKSIQNLKNTTLHIAKECGHVVNIEQPEEFNEVSISFLNNQQLARY